MWCVDPPRGSDRDPRLQVREEATTTADIAGDGRHGDGDTEDHARTGAPYELRFGSLGPGLAQPIILDGRGREELHRPKSELPGQPDLPVSSYLGLPATSPARPG